MLTAAKRLLVGRPIASSEEHHQRIRKLVALPVFASDAISSTAYATDEILVVLLAQAGIGVAAFTRLVPIALVVCALLAIVITSYRQTLFAYPTGGGSYIVSRENLGATPSLVAGASLLVDYILTVAVSVAGGVLAIRSAADLGAGWAVPLCLACIALMTVANLRGVKESGALFAGPTYFYILMLVLLIAVGLYRVFVQDLGPIPVADLVARGQLSEEALEHTRQAGALSVLLLLRAFSSGAVALSGVEAVSNGVPAFRKPESRNAATTLLWMAGILGSCFFGISLLASHLKPFRGEDDATGIALMAQHIYGGRGVLFWATQIATFAILILAANTAYADFPRLSSIIARDGFLPRQLANRGDRLAYSNGILFLAVVASLLIVVFKGNISALIPLYAVGVFTGFTLSQAGMVQHHRRLREPRWRLSAAINATGALTTGIVALVVVVSKFTEGAYLPAFVIAALVWLFRSIHRHYQRLGETLRITPAEAEAISVDHTIIVLVGSVHRGVLYALAYARSLRPERLIALHVAADDEDRQRIEQRWAEFGLQEPLETVLSPYRELTGAVLRYIDGLDPRHDGSHVITVMIPEFVVHRWWEHLLHNQSALVLKGRLLFRKHTVVTSIPFHVH
ncbi:MAG: APC family permease [Acidimicrobiales bacterium]